MLKETILVVQTSDLKVDISCDGCVKEIKKIMQRIDGVYQTNVDRKQGKVTVTGLMDMDIVFKKLKKAGYMSAQLWDANSTAVSKHQKLQIDGSDRGDQLNGAGGKSLPQGEANNKGGSDARSGGGTNDATMVLPQPIPTPQQQVPNIQQQIEQRLQMLNKEKLLPPHLMGMPPTINRGGQQNGKKIGGVTKVQVPGNANNDNKNDGQPLHNGGALGSLNSRSQAKKDNSVGVGSQMMSGSIVPQNGGMMRPANNMTSPTSFPIKGQMGGISMGSNNHLDGYNMQAYAGDSAMHGLGMPANGLPGNGFYPSSAGSNGIEMMQQVARNPMPQQPYLMVQPQQEHEKMRMNAHWPDSQNAHYGPGYNGYQLIGYDNWHGHLQEQYPPPMYYPMPLPHQRDNTFTDENPNICSLM